MRQKTLRIVCGANSNVRFLPPEDPDAYAYDATLHRAKDTYELEVGPEQQVWVNGERVDESRLLKTGDLLEVGRGGPVVRFRVYPADGAPQKSVAEVLSDSVNGARADGHTRLGATARLLSNLIKGLATQTAPVFRIWVLVVLSILVIILLLLAVQSVRLQKQLAVEETRIEGLTELLERAGAEALTKRDLREIKTAVELRLAEAVRRVQALEARTDRIARVIASASPATVFIYGEYRFVDPDTDMPLRSVEVDEGIKVFTFDERGEPVDVVFSGTGFVVSEQGNILTNRHVIEPWLGDEHANMVIQRGLVPRIQKLALFVPDISEPFDIRILQVSEKNDLALLRAENGLKGIPKLSLKTSMPRPGEEIVVLGYPMGAEGLMVRVSPEFLDAMTGSDLWAVLKKMSGAGHIRPLATRGIVSQVSQDTVAYDAETAVGGSGGPVLDLNGSVVAINRAVIEQFGGSNLGVPATVGSEFLARLESE